MLRAQLAPQLPQLPHHATLQHPQMLQQATRTKHKIGAAWRPPLMHLLEEILLRVRPR
jgi:hypothetical protein